MPFGGGALDIIQVEPGRVGVELEEFSVLLGRGEDLLQVDRVRLAAIDQPACGVGDDRDVRILQRPENPLGDLLA